MGRCCGITRLLVRLFVKNWGQTRDPNVRAAYGMLAAVVGIICNLVLVGGKLIAGLLSGSIAVVADAVNNISDASASIITLIGFKASQKPADREHPFGHARFEYIAALMVAVLVMAIGIDLARSSILKIIHPEAVEFGWLTFIVLGLSIFVKLWMALFNRAIGRAISSTALEATFADSRNDVISTAAVLAAAIIAKCTGLNLDGWMGLAVAVFILFSGFLLVRDTLNPLLGMAPNKELVDYVANKILSYKGVLATHELIVHDYGPRRRFASAHVEMSSDDDVYVSHDTIDQIERDFLENDDLHIILHYDPVITGNEAVDNARAFVADKVQGIDPKLSIHDFRMVDGPTHVNYIFDVVVPPGYGKTHDELCHQIQKAVQHGSRPVYTVITVDTSYTPIPD